MVLPIPPSNFTPIPNNPFYSPTSEYLQAASGPLVVGDGLQVNYQTGEIEVLTSSTPVTSIGAGLGISVANNGSGAYTVSNTGVVTISPGYGINITDLGSQHFQISSIGAIGTVTSVTAGPGLTGGVITTAGTIALRNIDPPVTGTYNYPQSMDVDTFGRVTSVTDGPAPVPLSVFSAKGQLAVGTAASTATALPLGGNGNVLIVDSTCPEGMRWGPVTETAVTCVQGLDPIYVSGTQFEPFVNISPATLTTCGAVRLSNSLNSSSIDDALTAAAGCSLQQQINALAGFTGTVSNVTGSYPIQITGNPTQSPNVEIALASTSNAGAVQLNDTTTSTSIVEALTANQGRVLQQQINSLATNLGANLIGTIDGSTGNMITVTPAGTADGFAPGSPLLPPTPAIATAYAIVEVAGTMTPPGGVPTAVDPGDWWFCDGATWIYLNVGVTPPAATETEPGIVELATPAEVQVGADTTRAVTAAGLQSKLSDSCNLPSSTTIASSQALATVYNIALAGCAYATEFTAGNICLANTSEVIYGTSINKAVTPAELKLKVSDSPTLFNSDYIASSLALATTNAVAVGAVQNSLVTNKGQILVGCQSGCVRNLPTSGNNGDVLTLCSSSLYGVEWAPQSSGTSLCGVTQTSIPYNTALGLDASAAGQGTVAIGADAGRDLSVDVENVFVGKNAGQFGGGAFCRSVLLGTGVGQGFTDICCTVGVGWGAQAGGNCNVTVGTSAGGGGSCTGRVAIGYQAVGAGSPGSYNTVVGAEAAYLMPSTSTSNVVIGRRAAGGGTSQTIVWGGQCAVAIGAGSNYCASLADNTVSVGFCSAIYGGTCTIAIGSCTANSTTNASTIAIGHKALWLDSAIPSDHSYTTAVGDGAGFNSYCNTGSTFVGNGAGFGSYGHSSVLIGGLAGYCYCDLVYNSGPDPGTVAIGRRSGFNSEGCRAILIGNEAGSLSIGLNESVAIGYCSLASSPANSGTVALGCFSGYDPQGDVSRSVFVGPSAGRRSTGTCNVHIGYLAGGSLNGDGNVIIGECAAWAAASNRTLLRTVVIGECAGWCTSGDNNVYIGANVWPASSIANCVTLISTDVSELIGKPSSNFVGIGKFGDCYYGGPWSEWSDQRVKTDIVDSALGLDFVKNLTPREFTWCHPDSSRSINGKRCVGIVAQEVLEAIGSSACAENLGLVGGSEEGMYTVVPTQFIWPLINAVKELSSENADLKARLANIETRLSALEG